MLRFAFALALALSLKLHAAQETQETEYEEAPPPPPVQEAPPPAPPPQQAAAHAQKDAEPPKDLHTEANRRLQELNVGQVKHYVRGAWLYGDYKQDHQVKDVVECAKECEKDTACFHWNY